jgi:hypothetical protein
MALAAMARWRSACAGLAPRLVSYGLVVIALVGAFSIAVNEETLAVQAAHMTIEQMQVTRADQAMWGRSAYGTQYYAWCWQPSGGLSAV